MLTPISLGTALTIPWRSGHTFLATAIHEASYLTLAKDYSDHHSPLERARLSNTSFAHVEVDDYIPGDLIHHRSKTITLEAEGDVFYLFEYFIIRKVANAGSTYSVSEYEGGGESPEGDRDGGESGEGVGGEGVGEDGGAPHGD